MVLLLSWCCGCRSGPKPQFHSQSRGSFAQGCSADRPPRVAMKSGPPSAAPGCPSPGERRKADLLAVAPGCAGGMLLGDCCPQPVRPGQTMMVAPGCCSLASQGYRRKSPLLHFQVRVNVHIASHSRLDPRKRSAIHEIVCAAVSIQQMRSGFFALVCPCLNQHQVHQAWNVTSAVMFIMLHSVVT